MKLEIEVSEEKILELAKVSSLEELPRMILNEARNQFINSIVYSLTNELVQKPYFNTDKEKFVSSIEKEIRESLSESIESFIDNYIQQKNLDYLVTRTINNKIDNLVQEKLDVLNSRIMILVEPEPEEEEV